MANEIEIRVTSSNASRPGFRDVERDVQRFGQTVRRDVGRAMNEMVSDTHKAAEETSQAMNHAFAGMAEDARDGGREAGKALTNSLEAVLDDAERSARDSGREIGDAVSRGASQRIRDSKGRFIRAGEDAGDAVGQGAEDSGGGRMRRAGGKMAGALRAAPWAAAGAAIGALVVQGVQGAMEAQDSTAVLKAQIGEFGAEGERLAKIAGGLFRKAYGESLGEVNEAVAAVVTSIRGMRGANATVIEDMTAKALDLSKVFGIEVSRSVQVVGQMVKTNLVRDARQGMDLLTAALQRVPAAVREDLVDALDEYGPFMEQIGIKGQRAFNILVAAADKGMYGLDKTGDAFKEITLKIASSADDVDEALRSIGLTQEQVQGAFARGGEEGRKAFDKIVKGLLEIKDPAERAETAITLFGTPIEDLNTKDIPDFLRGLQQTQDQLGQTSGAAEKMGETLHDTASERLTRFGRTLKGQLVDFLGGPVLGGLEEFTERGREIFEEWLEDHEEVTESARELWDKVKETFEPFFEDLEEWIEENRETIEGWGDDIAQVFEDMADIVGSALDIISELWEKFGPTILEILEIFIDTLVGNWKGLWRTLKGAFDFFAGLLSGDWERVWQGLMDIAGGLGDQISATIKGFLRLIAANFRGTWRIVTRIVKGAFDDVKDTAKRALDWVLEKIRGFGSGARKAFDSAVDGIRKVWRELKAATRDPVGWVVDNVYNKGIRRVWNLVAGIAGMSKLDWMRFQDGGVVDMRRGGVQPGFSQRDNRVGLFRDGEGVLVPEAVESLGGARFIDAVNRAGRNAKDVLLGGQVGSTRPVQAFQFGGIVGRLKSVINSGVNWLKGAPKLLVDKGITAWAGSILNPLLGRGPSGGGSWGDAMRTVPRTMITEFMGWVKKHLEELFAGGGDFGKALQWARTQHGKPYQWGGNGNPSWDCSGFMSAIESVIRGQSPHRRWSTHPFHSGAHNPMPGWYRDMRSNFMIGITSSGVGHTAGTLMGVPVESSGSGGVRVGPGARGHNHGMFQFRYGFRKADNGMIAQPGMNAFVNATGAPEELRPVDQIPEVHVHVHVENHGWIGSKIDAENMFARVLDDMRRQGRLAALVQEARGTQ